MVTITYYHLQKRLDYSKEFDDPYEARDYKRKLEHLKDKFGTKLYAVGYYCNTSYEMNVMEGVYK